jgi:hypothetical protein
VRLLLLLEVVDVYVDRSHPVWLTHVAETVRGVGFEGRIGVVFLEILGWWVSKGEVAVSLAWWKLIKVME